MGISYSQRMPVIKRIGDVEPVVTVIELESIRAVPSVIAAGGETDFVGMHFSIVTGIVKRFYINEGGKRKMGKTVGDHQHAS